MTRPHEWTLSGLQLVTPEPPSTGYWFETWAEGVDLGSPQGVRVVRDSLVQDGDDVYIPRWGNRQVQFTVAICGHTNADIAEGERVLAPLIGGRGTLKWTPPESGDSTLFEVQASSMQVVFDDLRWVTGPKYQAYQLTLDCRPWAYAETQVTEVFTPGAATYTVVNNASSAASWPGMSTATYLGQSVVRLQHTLPLTAPFGDNIDFTGTVPAGNYMYLDMAFEYSGYAGQQRVPFLGGVGYPLGALQTASGLAAGFTRYFWARKAGPLSFRVEALNMNAGDVATWNVNEFGMSNVLPTGSLFVLSMLGSVPVKAQLQISHPSSSASLGDIMVYADPTMMTHGWVPDNDDTWANAPDGSYWLWVRPTTYLAGDRFSIVIDDQLAVTVTEQSSGSSTPWMPMGPFVFGGKRSRRLGSVSGLSDGLNLARVSAGVTTNQSVSARLIREDDEEACLLYVHSMPTLSEGNTLFVEPPTLDQPLPNVFAGDLAGFGSVSLNKPTTFGGKPPLKSWAWPTLNPPQTPLWVSSSGTTVPKVTVVHRPAFHTFAAES